jgi:hypothetical protein
MPKGRGKGGRIPKGGSRSQGSKGSSQQAREDTATRESIQRATKRTAPKGTPNVGRGRGEGEGSDQGGT